jgi:hypothetical protein
VRVLLKEVWEARDGQPVRVWNEELPMVWSHFEETERTIGADADADFCFLIRGSEVVQLSVRKPPISLPRNLKPNISYVVVFVASGHEVDSERFCVSIRWDAGWDDDEVKMAEHLQVRPTTDPVPRRGR